MSSLAYSYEAAADECGGAITEAMLLAAWKAGELVVREASSRRPVILHRELEEYLERLPTRSPRSP